MASDSKTVEILNTSSSGRNVFDIGALNAQHRPDRRSNPQQIYSLPTRPIFGMHARSHGFAAQPFTRP
jgi:hypothetical protein